MLGMNVYTEEFRDRVRLDPELFELRNLARSKYGYMQFKDLAIIYAASDLKMDPSRFEIDLMAQMIRVS